MKNANEIKKESLKFRYQFLNRLQMDCNYFLGNGCRHEKDLWAQNVPDHIALMREYWHSFSESEKPEWLTLEQIDEYEKNMLLPVNEYEVHYTMPASGGTRTQNLVGSARGANEEEARHNFELNNFYAEIVAIKFYKKLGTMFTS